MKIKISDILELFELVNFGSPFDHEGYICRETGKTYFYSEYGDNEEELPEDIGDDKYLGIPHKNELNLGRNLALDFAHEYLPAEFDKVRLIFYRKGAYSRFKSLLENTGKLEEWYNFEAKHIEQALRDWCAEQDLEISG